MCRDVKESRSAEFVSASAKEGEVKDVEAMLDGWT